MLAELLAPRKTCIRWDQDEWEELATRVWKRRARHPEDNLIVHTNAVQSQQAQPGQAAWRDDRKRTITTMGQVAPLVPLLRKLDLEIVELRDRTIPNMQQTIDTLRLRPDKEQLLTQLTPEEICRRFTDTVFNSLPANEVIARFDSGELLQCISPAEIYAYLGQAMFGQMAQIEQQLSQHLVDHQHAGAVNGKTNLPLTAKAKPATNIGKPRIAIVGMQQHMLNNLTSQVGTRCDIIFVAKGADDYDQIKVDHVVMWETYVSGIQKQAVKKLFGSKLTIHRGNLEQLIHTVQRLPIVAAKGK